MKNLLLCLAIALPLILSGQAQRKVLIEEFTNASCGPCAAQNPDFNALLEANEVKVVPLKYQINFPGFDPMYQQNPSEVQTRMDYYGVDGVPSAWIDGILPDDDYAGGVGDWDVAGGGYEGGPYGYNQEVIDFQYQVETPLTIEIDHNVAEDFSMVTIDVKVKNVSDEAFGLANGKLHVVLFEKEINFPFAPGSNGEVDYTYVMRKMYPGDEGTVLGAILPGDSLEVSFMEPLPDYFYSKISVGALAFVQDDSDKLVYQAEISEPKPVESYFDTSIESLTADPTELCGASITPIVQITNEGTEEVTSFDVSYTLNDGTPESQEWTGALAAGMSETITFDEIMIPGGTVSLDFEVSNLNEGMVIDINSLNDLIQPQTFASLSEVAVADSIAEDNEAYEFEYPTSAVVNPPIDAGGFGWGSFLVVAREEITSSFGDPIGGYGESDRSIWINFYQWNPAEANAANDGTITYQKVDLTGFDAVNLTFDRAGARYLSSNDQLQIRVSTDCAETWEIVHDIQGADLSTVDGHTEEFYIPTAAQWETDTIDLSAYIDQEINVQFRAISAWGNGTFLDNINLVGSVVNSTNSPNLLEGKVQVFPNPTKSIANIEFELVEASPVTIVIYDMAGKQVDVLENASEYRAGSYIKTWNSPVEDGVYMARITTKFGEITKRITVIR